MSKILYVCAIEQECIALSAVHSVDNLVTGIGKCNASYELTRHLCLSSDSYDLVLNIGTAGTLKFQVGDILFCNQFVDRDLVKLKDYGLQYQTESLYKDVWPSFVNGRLIEDSFVANTGDDFVTSSEQIDGDVIDMEAYALASVCQRMNVPFVSVKYVTDVVGQNSLKHWEDKLADARKGLSDYFNHLKDYGFGKY